MVINDGDDDTPNCDVDGDANNNDDYDNDSRCIMFVADDYYWIQQHWTLQLNVKDQHSSLHAVMLRLQ